MLASQVTLDNKLCRAVTRSHLGLGDGSAVGRASQVVGSFISWDAKVRRYERVPSGMKLGNSGG